MIICVGSHASIVYVELQQSLTRAINVSGVTGLANVSGKNVNTVRMGWGSSSPKTYIVPGAMAVVIYSTKSALTAQMEPVSTQVSFLRMISAAPGVMAEVGYTEKHVGIVLDAAVFFHQKVVVVVGVMAVVTDSANYALFAEGLDGKDNLFLNKLTCHRNYCHPSCSKGCVLSTEHCDFV